MLDKEEYAEVILDLRSYPAGIDYCCWGSSSGFDAGADNVAELVKSGHLTEAECCEYG